MAVAPSAGIPGSSGGVEEAEAEGAQPVLITLTVSHFCEKARWALQRYGIPFSEEAHAPGFHYPAIRRAGSSRSSTPCLHFPLSSATAPAPTSASASASARAKCVEESTDILWWVDQRQRQRNTSAAGSDGAAHLPLLFPPEHAEEVSRLCAGFDRDLGPAARSWVYAYMLRHPATLDALVAPPVPLWQRITLTWGAWPIVRSAMANGMKISPENGQAAYAKVQQVFEEVSARLEDGRRYLVGDVFTAADLTFAALAAPAVGQPYSSSKGLAGAVPEQMRREIEGFRGTAAGQFCLRLWAEERAVVL